MTPAGPRPDSSSSFVKSVPSVVGNRPDLDHASHGFHGQANRAVARSPQLAPDPGRAVAAIRVGRETVNASSAARRVRTGRPGVEPEGRMVGPSPGPGRSASAGDLGKSKNPGPPSRIEPSESTEYDMCRSMAGLGDPQNYVVGPCAKGCRRTSSASGADRTGRRERAGDQAEPGRAAAQDFQRGLQADIDG
jgi:hypothetical protein